MRGWIAALALVVLFLAPAAGPLCFKAVYPWCLAYLVLFAVYALPAAGWAQRRDYSYGLYIYGFVVQQTIVHFVPGISPGALIAASLCVTLVLAIASWHLVEKPALAGVERCAALLSTAMRPRIRTKRPE